MAGTPITAGRITSSHRFPVIGPATVAEAPWPTKWLDHRPTTPRAATVVLAIVTIPNESIP